VTEGPDPFEHLPHLPALADAPKVLFQRILLAYIVHLLGSHDPVAQARRVAAATFNRASAWRVGRHFRLLRKEHWLSLAVPSVGWRAHMYSRGRRLTKNDEIRRQWDAVAAALYGPEGLLSPFMGSSAFGFKMPKETGLLCLGALSRATRPVTPHELANYLAPLMAKSTVMSAVDRLIGFGLVGKSEGVLTVVADWEERLDLLCATEPAGDKKLQRNLDRWAHESEDNISRCVRGDITDQELARLKRMPCVRCWGRSGQVEHFPPRSFLRAAGLPEHHPFVLWAICRGCNVDMGSFIRGLPKLLPPPFYFQFGPPGSTEPLPDNPQDFFGRLYIASTEVQIRAFYRAFEELEGDEAKAEALKAIMHSLSFYKFMVDNLFLPVDRNPWRPWPFNARSKKGRGARSKPSRLPW